MTALTALIGFVLSILVGAGGYYLARLKGRPASSNRWFWLMLIFPFMLPIFAVFVRRKEEPNVTWKDKVVVVVANAAICGVIGLAIWSTYYNGVSQGLPACGSPAATTTAKEAIADSPAGKLSGLAIIDLSAASEISSSDTQRQCTATALMNNAQEQTASYRIFNRPGSAEWFVSITLTPRDVDTSNPQ